MTDAERTVQATIAADGVHVVHVWAPWCDNSLNELDGWRRSVDAHPDVTVTFVTVWNDGDAGEAVLAEHGMPGRVVCVVVPGPKPEKPDRRLTFLDLPVTWIPTTWVFNRGGLLATAFNYGEVTPDQIAAAIAGAQSDW